MELEELEWSWPLLRHELEDLIVDMNSGRVSGWEGQAKRQVRTMYKYSP